MENHRITEWFGMEGALKLIHGWGHPWLLQAFNTSRSDIGEGRGVLAQPGQC